MCRASGHNKHTRLSGPVECTSHSLEKGGGGLGSLDRAVREGKLPSANKRLLND